LFLFVLFFAIALVVGSTIFQNVPRGCRDQTD
jgi:hypothetical protein